ncbi:hypothetical protein DFP93_10724 [Aneurinibacillus soli]|uniref:Uncharacterized protein n=1 Tax=Aneurinibacillus soli TaxID=1500254 RepID=A0A0U4WIS6_9BACL|nr:hypothetical protein DFP93_10724 [Aneurinibacillus soli]BAU28507.1 hypothetical protein CB4_02681 [Aneurinibacillus soli]
MINAVKYTGDFVKGIFYAAYSFAAILVLMIQELSNL